jgi:hypothetical protein
VVDVNKPGSRNQKHFSEDMIRECLATMESGDIEDLFEIIPRIGVLRDPRFNKPLTDLLFHGDIKRREFAAYSMGAIGSRDFVEPLEKAFLEAKKMKGFGAQELQIAIIEAIGSIGDDAAVEFFVPALKTCCAAKSDPEHKTAGRNAAQLSKWIIESLGAIAQQGGQRSLEALLELASSEDPEIQAQALSELSVAYWHRPNDVEDSTLQRIYALTSHKEPMVAESALAALQNLADVGCIRAEAFFTPEEE